MRTEGSVIPHLYQKDFVDLDFPIPELRVQDKIVGILDAINNKIKLNKSINNNLPPHLCVAQIAATQRRQALKTNGCLHTDGEVSGRGGNLKAPQVFSSRRVA